MYIQLCWVTGEQQPYMVIMLWYKCEGIGQQPLVIPGKLWLIGTSRGIAIGITGDKHPVVNKRQRDTA